MKRLERVLLLSLLLVAVILIHSSEGNNREQNKQFSHRRIQSGPPKFNRRPPPPPPHHRQRRPNRPDGPVRGGGDRERERNRDREGGNNSNNNGGPPPNKQYHHGRQPQGPPPPHHHGPPPSRDQGPPPNRHQNNNQHQRPGPPYPPPPPPQQNNNNKPPQQPMHPYTQQSPMGPAPSTLNPPMPTHIHPQQPPMTNPPISEYAPPLNTFKSYNNNNMKLSDQQGAHSIMIPQQNGTNKQTITFTVTKKPSGATAINFHINTPKNGQNNGQFGVGPSTYRPPLDPSYPNSHYTMKDATPTPQEDTSANDLLNPPPVFYNPHKDVVMNKDHPLNHKNEIPSDSEKFSQPDPLFHSEQDNSKASSDNHVESSVLPPSLSNVLIAGHNTKQVPPSKGKGNSREQPDVAQQLLAALGLSKDPLITMGKPQGEPLGLNDYLKSQPLFNKPDRIIDEPAKDQDHATSDHLPSLYDDFDSYINPNFRPPTETSFTNKYKNNDENEQKLSSYLQHRLRQENVGENQGSQQELYDRQDNNKNNGPVSYIEQKLKGNTPNSNAFGSGPANNFGSNFGLINNENKGNSYLEQKLRQDLYNNNNNEQSYIQQLINKEQQQKGSSNNQDLNGAFAHQQPVKPALDLSQFPQKQRFGPSTQSPSSLELEEYDKTGDSIFQQPGLYGQGQGQGEQQLTSASGKIGLLSGNVLLPGGFGGLHLQQQQQQQQQLQGNLGFGASPSTPIFNRQQQLLQQQLSQQSQSIPQSVGPIQQQYPHQFQQQQPQGPVGSLEQGQVPYAPQHYPQQPQETQQFQQRLNFDQTGGQISSAPQYQAINPALQQQQLYQQQQPYPQQQPHPQASIQNYNYQVPPQQNQQQQPIPQQSHPHPNALPPGPGYGPPPPPPGGPHHHPGPHGPPPTPQPNQVFVVTEAEPIIEIIVQDSNVTLPPQQIPTPPPPPPPTPEPVHVFYVKYSENKFPGGPHHDPEINLESPIPSINVRGPDRNLQVDPSSGFHDSLPQLSEQHHRHLNVSSSGEESGPPPQQQQTTTLRTLIDPSQNSFSDTKLAVHFDQPPEQYPFDMQQYQQKQAEQQQQDIQTQHQQHQQLIQQINQQSNHQFLSKRIGLEEFSSLLQDEPQTQQKQQQHQHQQQQPHPQVQHHQQHHHQHQHQNHEQPEKTHKDLPADVPQHLREQLINSGILNHADVQVVNFDENLFKELSSLPPEALSALQKQTEFPGPFQQEDLSTLQKRHAVSKVFIERRQRKRPRSILFRTEDNHLYRLKNLAKRVDKVERIC